jgi:hypothetical protein
MPRLDCRPDHALLLRVLQTPAGLARLSPEELSRTIDAAESARLLGWLVTEAGRRGLPSGAPAWLGDRWLSACALVDEYDRSLRWEMDRLDRALGPTGVRWVLLKGAAYLAAGLPAGRGRRVADIDILVPQASLPEVERALQAHGWDSGELDPYDERYYREWMHELPPMVHAQRGAVVDVHHAILPKTGRLRPESARLLDQAVEIAPGLRVPAPPHLILHAAAHLFHDGEIAGAIRDLVDLDRLLRDFDGREGFWPSLLAEAQALDLGRPAYYAVRYARRLFGTPVPAGALNTLDRWAPPGPITATMDRLVARTIAGPAGSSSSAAALALYVRSHWLRMPPALLARHLVRKAVAARRPTRA